MVNYDVLERRISEWQQEFRSSPPFRHCVIDQFLNAEAAEAICKQFPDVDAEFQRHIHLHSHKYASNNWATFPSSMGSACRELNGERFVRFLSLLTGIAPLYADPDLFGGGMHIITRGGFLNIHADFNEHPVLKKKRCQNLRICLPGLTPGQHPRGLVLCMEM